jgi:UDP-3-O-[3-hydroxymyristoyl] N-acetylglucosamine deacetylase
LLVSSCWLNGHHNSNFYEQQGNIDPMNPDYIQKTIAKPVSCSGVGLHSGKHANLTVHPAPANHGIKFRRVDLLDQPSIPARFNKVVDTSLATVIGNEGFIVSTIEHLMAALAGLSIDNALVDVDSHELPVMDGSAGPYVRMLLEAGIQHQSNPRCFFTIKHPIELEEDGKFVGVYPADQLRISYTIEYDHPLIRTQSHSSTITPDLFSNTIAEARTFCLLHEVEQMKANGLALGGSLDNAVVIDGTEILNEDGLRYEDEFVRHKLLDCIGDFSLLGLPIMGHIVARRSGHNFNRAFLGKFFTEKESWVTRTFEKEATSTEDPGLKQLAN